MLDCSSVRDIDNRSTKRDRESKYHCKKIVALHTVLVELILYLLFHIPYFECIEHSCGSYYKTSLT
jgi:hypothetical protein